MPKPDVTSLQGLYPQQGRMGTNPFCHFCLNQNRFVNINGVSYEYKNTSWVPITREIILLYKIIRPTFAYQDVKFEPLDQQANPSMIKTMTSHVDIMADIIATMGEHATWDQS